MHAHASGVVFTIQVRDLFLPRDPENHLRAWQTCDACNVDLVTETDPLDFPRGLELARKVVGHAAWIRAIDPDELQVDLTFVMAGFHFEGVRRERTVFVLEGAEVPLARLRHIVESKAAVGRHEDQLFLATHEENLRQLLGLDED
ncbi:MAG: hypothetical protein L6Q99_12505 [Planctomycetes bacterium]|nr:hypothetical protein [Planctomycetota bacterium]